MRIAFLTSQLTIGGGERQLVRTADHLARAGAEVLVISTTPSLQALDLELGGPEGTPAHVVGIDEPTRRRRLDAARRLLRATSPDVLVGWLRSATVWAPLLGAAAGIPTLRLAERTTLDAYPPAWRRARLLAARRADRVVANAEHAAEQWRRAAPWVDVRVAPNLPPPLLAPIRQPDGDAVRFVLVGRLVPAKGVDVAIDALARACAAGLDAELVVVGRDYDGGATSAALRRRADEQGVGSRLELRPPDLRGVADVRPFADVLLVPSRWEGSSNVLAEGLAAGLPVLASEAVVAPWPGISFPTAPIGDAEALAEHMVGRAWEATSVGAGTFAEWARAAGGEAEAAWLS